MVATAGLVGCAIRGPLQQAEDDSAVGGGAASSSSGSPQGGASSSSGSGAHDTGSSSGSGAAGASSGSSSGSGAAGAGSGSSSGTGGNGSSSSSGTAGGGTGGSGGLGPGGCYTEGYDLGASLGDLQSGYQGSQWLPTMLSTLSRRYSNGWYLLDQMKTDPWLTGSFPSYFDLSNWPGMIDAIDTACHEESHGYDFEQAMNSPGKHFYYMGANLEAVAAELSFFPRNEILSFVSQGGSVTSSYDSTYLTGTQGSYDFIFLADELTAYINGLACATSVGEQFSGGHSFRDGAAAHLFYLEAYLKIARTGHPSLYAQWQADADWQKFVRYSWARGHYWTNESLAFPALGINDAAIWNRIDDPNNLSEIELFTGDDPTVVACTP